MKKHISDIGEFGLIEAISKSIKTGKSVVKGIGDDCAVLRYKKNKHLLFTTDMIIEAVHFDRKGATAMSIGHKALAVNISDIAACGGIPKWAVVSAGIPKHISVTYAHDIYRGISSLAQRFGIDIVGGDTNCSRKLVLSIALLGEVLKEELLMRNGAHKGDSLVITGPLNPEPDHLNFIPKVKESRFIVKELMPTSMIDISDGLLSDLRHILEKSHKGALLYESLIPVIGRNRLIRRAMNTGEQFELLFTMPKGMISYLPKEFYVIGEISDDFSDIVFVRRSGRRERIVPKGYTHF
jgi:thiamine-monophosphate kinase